MPAAPVWMAGALQSCSGALRRLWHAAERRPVLTVLVVALTVRIAVVLILTWLGVQFHPDERVFWRLAVELRAGESDDWEGYSLNVYRNGRLFIWLLASVQALPGATLLTGQLLVALLGAAAAAVTAGLGRRLVSPVFGLVAGLLVALWPAQIVFSASALRESALWLVLVSLAWLAVAADDARGRRLTGIGLAIAGLLLAAVWLRPTTAIVAGLALLLAMLSSERSWRPVRVGGALVLLAVIPMAAGLGPAGSELLAPEAIEQEQAHRAAGSGDAACTDLGHEQPATSVTGAASRTVTTAPHVLLGPVPWQPVCSTFGQMAKPVGIGFLALLLLAGLGWWREQEVRRRLRFGTWFLVGMLAFLMLAQDNVGTAFRHREQVLWTVALFATAGLGRFWPRLTVLRDAPSGARNGPESGDSRPAGAMGQEPVRVLTVIKGLGRGGAERLIVDQVTAPVGGVAFEVANTDGRIRDLASELTSAGIEVHHLGGRRWWLLGLRARLRRGPPVDVVHVHSPRPAVLIRLLRRTLPRQERPVLVTSEHALPDAYHPLTRCAHRCTLSLDDHRFAVSEQVRSALPARELDVTEVLHPGTDLARAARAVDRTAAVRAELGIPTDTPVVISVGRLRREKDHPTLLAAARLVLDHSAGVRFLVVGDGPERARVQECRRAFGLQDAVQLLGDRSDAAELIAASDVLCVSSRTEGLGLVVLEAMAAGVPVVATAAGGVVELIRDGVEGRLVPVGDAGALARGLSELLGDDRLRERMGAAARTRASRFDCRRAHEQLGARYRQLAAERA